MELPMDAALHRFLQAIDERFHHRRAQNWPGRPFPRRQPMAPKISLVGERSLDLVERVRPHLGLGNALALPAHGERPVAMQVLGLPLRHGLPDVDRLEMLNAPVHLVYAVIKLLRAADRHLDHTSSLT